VLDSAISVRGLRRFYGSTKAVRGIDLDVEHGEVFAFLGPNGAGKTTTVEILEGYRNRDEGEISVLGQDPADGGRAWRERIGIVLQKCQLQPLLTVRETLDLYAGYYSHPRATDETIELVGLAEQSDARAGRLSGGQQRRLDVGVALIGDPELLFLDEPTTGFDPSARRQAWDVIASLRRLGKTIFLTTHYMDEAQTLADRVAIISNGRIVARGTPDELSRQVDLRPEIKFRLANSATLADLPPPFAAADVDGRTVQLRVDDPVRALHELTGWALESGSELAGLEVGNPSFEDVYLRLTAEDQIEVDEETERGADLDG
jgi:ABC-2 type transport system ATP-binding protein